MTNPTTPKRWWPRFSVRTYVVFVTLVCCYAACWWPTKTWGLRNVVSQNVDWNGEAIFPRIIGVDVWEPIRFSNGAVIGNPGPTRRCYYFWFFGCVAKLPYDREVG